MKCAIYFIIAAFAWGLFAGCNLNPQPLPPETFATSDGGQAGGSGSANSSSGGGSGGTGINGSSGGGSSGSGAGGSGSGGFVNSGDAGAASAADATVDAGGGPLGGDAGAAHDAANGLDAAAATDAAGDGNEERATVTDAFTGDDVQSDVAREVAAETGE
jgi:hypothetical protein